MQIERVELENYGSYQGKHSVILTEQGLVLVLGDNQDEPRMDSNGAAKSSLFEAVDWCLFGVVPKGDHVDSVINDQSSFVHVVVHILDEDVPQRLRVERGKQRSKSTALKMWLGDQLVQMQDTRETQRHVEAALGLDRDVFHAAVFYAQTDMLNFAEATESKRMELFSKILPELRQIDQWIEPAKAKAKEYAEVGQRAQMVAAQAQTRLAEIEQNLASLDQHAAQWGSDQCAKIANLEQQVASASQHAAQARVALTQCQNSVPQAVGDHPPEKKQAYLKAEQELAKIQREQQTWYSWQQTHQQKVREYEAALQRIRNTGEGQCPQCFQPISRGHLQQEIQRIQQVIVQEQNDGAYASRCIEESGRDLQAQQAVLAQMQREHEQAVQHYYRMKAEYDAYAPKRVQAQQAVDQADAYWQRCWQELETAKTAVNPVESQRADLQYRKERAVIELNRAKAGFEQSLLSQRYADFWVAAFGPKGLRNYVLDHRLQEMTDAVNHWVRLLTGGTIWVRFETQKMGRSTKKLSNEITIRIFRFNPDGKIIERNYKSWSGGEKRRVGWAIDFGLSRLIAARAQKRYDLLILDEVFRHVDRAGGEAVAEMLKALRQERSSIFVVEHDSAFQTHFEKQWTVVKKNGCSALRCETEGSHDGRGTVAKQGQTKAGQAAKKRTKAMAARAAATAKRRAKRG